MLVTKTVRSAYRATASSPLIVRAHGPLLRSHLCSRRIVCLRLPEKPNRVVVEDLLLLGFGNIIARQDLFGSVVAPFAVR